MLKSHTCYLIHPHTHPHPHTYIHKHIIHIYIFAFPVINLDLYKRILVYVILLLLFISITIWRVYTIFFFFTRPSCIIELTKRIIIVWTKIYSYEYVQFTHGSFLRAHLICLIHGIDLEKLNKWTPPTMYYQEQQQCAWQILVY